MLNPLENNITPKQSFPEAISPKETGKYRYTIVKGCGSYSIIELSVNITKTGLLKKSNCRHFSRHHNVEIFPSVELEPQMIIDSFNALKHEQKEKLQEQRLLELPDRKKSDLLYSILLHETFLSDLAKMIHAFLPFSTFRERVYTHSYYVYNQLYEIHLTDHTDRYSLWFKGDGGWSLKPKYTNKKHLNILLMYFGADKCYNLLISDTKLVLPEAKLTREIIYNQVRAVLTKMGVLSTP